MEQIQSETEPIALSDTGKIHRKQSIWQIWLPLGFTIALFITIAVMAILSTNNSESSTQMAAISIISLIIPTIFIALIFLVVLIAIIYGLSHLIKLIPDYGLISRTYIDKGVQFIQHYADRSVRPIIFIRKYKASIDSLLNKQKNKII
ncbi:MAG: hypothetical protein JEZ06_16520 [Anaerolineaceae bacterium]|nr:hypothetical protein [Anaerolineaceae bacterium]